MNTRKLLRSGGQKVSAKEAEKIRQELTTGYITNITHQLGDFHDEQQ